LKKNRWLPVFMKIIAAALLMSLTALAEEGGDVNPLSFDDYVLTAAFADAEWEADGTDLIRVVSPEEGVTVSVCLNGENIAAVTVEYPVGQPTDSAVMAIEGLGWLSPQMVENVFAQQAQEMIEAECFNVCRVVGEMREAVSICRAEDAENMVWQPIHGGARIHDKPRCSGMDVSRMITEEAAQAVGWENCGRCRKNK